MKKFLLLFIICFAITSCKDTDKDGVYDRNDGCPIAFCSLVIDPVRLKISRAPECLKEYNVSLFK